MTFGSVFIPLLFLLPLLSGCLKKQDLESSNLGPPVASTKVESDMLEAFGDLDFDSVRLNQSNEATFSVRFENGPKIDLFTQFVNVREKLGAGSNIEFVFDFNYTDHQSPSNNIIGKLFSMRPYGEELQSKADPVYPRFPLFIYFDTAQFLCKTEKVSCHNLKIVENIIRLPSSQADLSICPNLSNCVIPLKTIEFDVLNFNDVNSEGKPERSHITFQVADRLPVFSKILSYCVRGLYEADGQKTPADQCLVTNNFTVGDTP